MTNMDYTPKGLKPACYVGFLQVGTAYLVTEIEQQFRDAAHTYAANTDKMYMLTFPVHSQMMFLGFICF